MISNLVVSHLMHSMHILIIIFRSITDGSTLLCRRELQNSIFKIFDQDNDGYITKEEFLNISKKANKKQDTKHNETYKAILTARDKVLTLIGTLQTDKLLRGEEVVEEEVDVEKLSEKNMLGRLAKSMSLNEENKQKLFDYFESGELEQ